ncbi:MAG: twin-arginine translocase TatA/TatE family subunit [bacterium]|jgi:TatA/E family protein of Tat protein translocase
MSSMPLLVSPSLAFIQNLGWMEMLVIMALLLLLFGRRLPEVGKSLGKGIVEFKKGLSGVEDQVNSAGRTQQPAAMPPAQAAYQQPLPPGQGQGVQGGQGASPWSQAQQQLPTQGGPGQPGTVGRSTVE